MNCYKFNLSREITQKLKRGDNRKYGHAQQLMLNNIPIKFEDSRSYGCRVSHAAKLVIIYVKYQYFRGNNSKSIKGRIIQKKKVHNNLCWAT